MRLTDPTSLLFPRHLVLAFLILCFTPLFGQSADLNAERSKVETSISRFQLALAEDQIAQLSDLGYQKFYTCNLLMYKFFGTQDVQYIQKVRSIWESTLSTLEALPEEDPLKHVLLAELYCKRSAIEVLDNNYLTAVRLARTGRSLIRRNYQRDADNVEQLKILGTMNIVLGAIPSKYKWITNSLGFKGNLTEGLKQLELAANKSSLLRLEAQLILSFVEKNILNQPEAAIQRMQQIRANSGSHFVIDYFLATGLLGVKRCDEALSILSQKDQYADQEVFEVPFWEYQLGKAYYFKNDHRNAQRHLARFLTTYQGKLVKTDANFRLGMALTLSDSYALGKQFFKNIIDGEISDLDADAYASHMATQFHQAPPSPATQRLFRARNYFDGGYYELAQQELAQLQSQMSLLSPDEQTECLYRLGRVAHAQGQLDSALVHYQQCIASSASEAVSWLHPYAWFHQANIAKAQGKLEEARSGYKTAISFDGYFYQAGLENRCKAALNELKQNG